MIDPPPRRFAPPLLARRGDRLDLPSMLLPASGKVCNTSTFLIVAIETKLLRVILIAKMTKTASGVTNFR